MKDNLQVLLRGANTVGMSAYFDTATPPEGWFERAGTVLLRAEFPEIWAYALANNLVIANSLWTGTNVTKFSDGDGSTTFKLPDNRGDFVRNWDNGRGVDVGRTIGSYQPGTKIAGEIGEVNSTNSHTIHNINEIYGDPIYETTFNKYVQYSAELNPVFESTSFWKTTRPRNTALLFCIKY